MNLNMNDCCDDFAVHSYECGQLHLGMRQVIPSMKSAMCQDRMKL